MSTERTERTRIRRNGEGSVRVRPDGRYEVRWRDANFQRRSRYAATSEEAHAILAGIVAARYSGAPEPSRRYTLGTWLPVWLDSIPPSRLRASSRLRYTQWVRAWQGDVLRSKRLPDITPEMVGAALGRMHRAGVSTASQAGALAVLRMALEAALRGGHVARNVATLVDPPVAVSRPIEPPKGADLLRLRAAIAADPYEAMWLLALDAGLRHGEILALRWVDVNLSAGLVNVRGTLQKGTSIVGDPKSRKSRRVLPLAPEVVDALRRRRSAYTLTPSPFAWVFPGPDGNAQDHRNTLGRWYTLCKRAGVKRYRLHDLRHAAITAMLAAGSAPGYVSRWAGHSSLRLTDRYTHTELPAWEEEAHA